MSESQFDKMLKALKNKDAEIVRLRELLKKCQPYVGTGMSTFDPDLCEEVEEELCDE